MAFVNLLEMVTDFKDNLLIKKQMDLDVIFIQMVLYIVEIGKMINNKDLE